MFSWNVQMVGWQCLAKFNPKYPSGTLLLLVEIWRLLEILGVGQQRSC